MPRQFTARQLDIKLFADETGALAGSEPLSAHPRLLLEAQGRGADTLVHWSASAEVRDRHHVRPQVWLHLKAHTTLSLICQRCLMPVEVPVLVDRFFRFVSDEETAAAEDDRSDEDVLALSRDFDLVELAEDELLMELPLAPHHGTCPPVHLEVTDESFEGLSARRENPFAVLGQLKITPKA
jgi:uncharacterized protein